MGSSLDVMVAQSMLPGRLSRARGTEVFEDQTKLRLLGLWRLFKYTVQSRRGNTVTPLGQGVSGLGQLLSK